jgi:hypothetical protein
VTRRALLLAAFLLVGCAAQPIEPPRIEVFSKADRKGLEMPAPATLPPRPSARLVNDPAGDLAAFDKDGALKLIARDKVCEANTEIARHCAAGFNDLERERQVLLQQALLLEQQHNYMAERWAQAEQELRQRERERAIETWLTRLLLAGAFAAAAD